MLMQRIGCVEAARSVFFANYKAESGIPDEMSTRRFENVKPLQNLSDRSGGGTDFLPTGVFPKRSACEIRSGQGSESSGGPCSTPRHFRNLGTGGRAGRWNPGFRRKCHAERREAGA